MSVRVRPGRRVCAERLEGLRETIAGLKASYADDKTFWATDRKAGCGRTRIATRCRAERRILVYGPGGDLVEMRWGKSYVNETFDAPCKR